MDWRHVGELSAAGAAVFTEIKNICVWNKSNAGMGTFYRSKHELVFVFKVGTAPTREQLRAWRHRTLPYQRLGTIRGSPAWAQGGWRSWRCIRPSNRPRW